MHKCNANVKYFRTYKMLLNNTKDMSVRFVFIDEELDKGVNSVKALAREGADKHWQEFYKGGY